MSYVVPADTRLPVGSRAAGVVAPPWAELASRMTPTGIQSSGTVFLHERTSPSGHRRLVVVDAVGTYPLMLDRPRGGPVQLETCLARVIRPGSPGLPPVGAVNDSTVAFWVRPPDVLLPGPVDPIDRSHLQFRCQRTGQPDAVVDGWLRDDDTVAFETSDFLDPPLTPAPPPGTPRRTVGP